MEYNENVNALQNEIEFLNDKINQHQSIMDEFASENKTWKEQVLLDNEKALELKKQQYSNEIQRLQRDNDAQRYLSYTFTMHTTHIHQHAYNIYTTYIHTTYIRTTYITTYIHNNNLNPRHILTYIHKHTYKQTTCNIYINIYNMYTPIIIIIIHMHMYMHIHMYTHTIYIHTTCIQHTYNIHIQ